MYLRTCRKCGCTMDAGEGKNGYCEECISGETERQRRENEMNRMIRATSFHQMEMEEIFNGFEKVV